MSTDLSRSVHEREMRLRAFVCLWLLPAYLAACLVAYDAVLAGKRLMQTDELFTWYPVSASFKAMFVSTTDTINSSPPLYFILAWLWAALLGSSALSLRLLSSVAFVAALLVLFKVLQRTYGVLAAGAALAVALLKPELLYQSASARFYMLMLAEMALAVLVYQKIMRQRRPSIGLLATNASIHAGLVMTHYFGLVYSGAILAAVFLTCRVRRCNPWREALSILAGWLVFLPWIPVFLRHLRMGKPTFWILMPNFADLQAYYGGYLTMNFSVLAAILCLLAIFAMWFAGRWRSQPPKRIWPLFHVRRSEAPLLILAALLASVPAAIYFISTRPGGTSAFLPRYLLPVSLGWAILCAHLANRVFRLRFLAKHFARATARLQWAAIALFVGWCGWDRVEFARQEQPQSLSVQLLAAEAASEPVVMEYIHDFMHWHFYSPESPRDIFLIDRKFAVEAGGGVPADHQIVEALQRQFPDRFKEVMPYQAFLARTKSFWVFDDRQQWWRFRLAGNPAFVIDKATPDLSLIHFSRR